MRARKDARIRKRCVIVTIILGCVIRDARGVSSNAVVK